MVTAKLTSRTYVPAFTSARGFANIEFMGSREAREILKNLMHEIEYRKYHINDSLINWYDGFKELNNKKIQVLNSQIKKLKDEHKLPIMFYKNAYKQIKALKKQIESLNSENDVFSCNISELDNARFLSASSLKISFEVALSDLEFHYKSEAVAGKERLTDISLYEFNGDENQLIINANAMIKDIKGYIINSVDSAKKLEKARCAQKGINIEEKENEIKKQKQAEEEASRKDSKEIFDKYMRSINYYTENIKKLSKEIQKKVQEM